MSRWTLAAAGVAAVASITAVTSGALASAGTNGVVLVHTSSELSKALAGAYPGQVINLADGKYSGHFVAQVAGTASAPIVLRGSRNAVLDGGAVAMGITLRLRGVSHWRLENFTVRGAQKGIVLDGSSQNVLTGLDIGQTGMEAVHFRSGSSDNALEYSDVHDTGRYAAGYGEGVYIGSALSNWSTYGNGGPDRSDRNTLLKNHIWATTAENIDIKEGTVSGAVTGNSLDGTAITGANDGDSLLDLKGNNYRVEGNTGVRTPLDGFQTHVQLDGWGRGNVFAGNILSASAAGYGIRVQTPSGTANVVQCDNIVRGASLGLANMSCT